MCQFDLVTLRFTRQITQTLEVTSMDSAVIKSGNTAATLTFSERDGDYFSVTYESPSVTLRKRVWGYTDCEFLFNLFSSLLKNGKAGMARKNGHQSKVSLEYLPPAIVLVM